jgi:hypothetical protein
MAWNLQNYKLKQTFLFKVDYLRYVILVMESGLHNYEYLLSNLGYSPRTAF